MWGGYAYGRGLDGREARADMESAFRRIAVAAKNTDTREHDIADSDDYFQFHGGMVAMVRHLTGDCPRRLHRRLGPAGPGAHPDPGRGDPAGVPVPRGQPAVAGRDGQARVQGRVRDGRYRGLPVRLRRDRRRGGRLDVRAARRLVRVRLARPARSCASRTRGRCAASPSGCWRRPTAGCGPSRRTAPWRRCGRCTWSWKANWRGRTREHSGTSPVSATPAARIRRCGTPRHECAAANDHPDRPGGDDMNGFPFSAVVGHGRTAAGAGAQRGVAGHRRGAGARREGHREVDHGARAGGDPARRAGRGRVPVLLRPGRARSVLPGRARTSRERRRLPAPARLVELPVGASEDRLVGALDIERALTEGRQGVRARAAGRRAPGRAVRGRGQPAARPPGRPAARRRRAGHLLRGAGRGVGPARGPVPAGRHDEPGGGRTAPATA